MSLIRAAGIVKEFSGVRVLHGIDLEIEKGEVFGLIGENGAGKSTLVKILAGFYAPTAGEFYLRGKCAELRNTQAAKGHGIVMIHQELNLADDLTVEENIFLGAEKRKPRSPFLDKEAMANAAKALLASLETYVDPKCRVGELRVADKQMVEIAKAASADAEIIIMDEPTAVLTQHEIDILFNFIRRLKESGVTVIYISHRLREVRQICDRVAVLRDGHLVTVKSAENLTEGEMASLMVGRELSLMYPPKAELSWSAPVVLAVEGLTVPGKAEGVSFKLRQGEILGIAGLVGAGKTELAEGIMGLRRISAGTIKVHGDKVCIEKPKQAISAGIAYLSEDRKGSGIHIGMSIQKNLTFMNLKSYCHPFIDRELEDKALRLAVDRYDIKAPALDITLEKLSGGNQQKVSLAKVMEVDPGIIILDEPTRGIDINTKQQIYRFIRRLVAKGKSFIVISSELPELIGLCNRVLVMRNGRISGEVVGSDITEEEIIMYATGLKGDVR